MSQQPALVLEGDDAHASCSGVLSENFFLVNSTMVLGASAAGNRNFIWAAPRVTRGRGLVGLVEAW